MTSDRHAPALLISDSDSDSDNNKNKDIGAPGIYSSRYASSDKQRIEKLLAELKPFPNRKAKFECALCIASGEKVLIEVSGFCEGLITFFPRGENGFGYDPIFEVSSLGRTFAEMNHEKKKQRLVLAAWARILFRSRGECHGCK